MEFNIHYAKTNLSQLLLKAESGEEVVIARAGKPVARLVPVEVQPTRRIYKPGILKGRLKIAPDAFSPEVDEEIARLFNEGPLFSAEAAPASSRKSNKTSRKKGKHKR
jgi:prevent-host-death family protein